MRPKNRVFCAYAGRPKLLFESKSKADNFIKRNAEEIANESKTGKKPVRSYYCTACGGWHVTSREKSANPHQHDESDNTENKHNEVQPAQQAMTPMELESTVWMLVSLLDRECDDKTMTMNIDDSCKMVMLLDRVAYKSGEQELLGKVGEYKDKIADKTLAFLSAVLTDRARYTDVGASDVHRLIRILGTLGRDDDKVRMIKKAKLMQRTLHERRRIVENRISFMKGKLNTAFALATNGLLVKAGDIIDRCEKIASEIRKDGFLPRKVSDSLEYIENKIMQIRGMGNPVTVVSNKISVEKKDGTEEEAGDSPAG